jgi:RimJ/RimL family protein N-acetyltransferase
VYPVRIDGDLVSLGELAAGDVDAVQKVVGDPAVTETLIFEPKDHAETFEYVERFLRMAADEPRTVYYLGVFETGPDSAAAAGGTAELVGTAALTVGEHRSGAIGYAIRADRWGRGYATAATRMLIDFGFRTLRLHRVWASHAPGNPASRVVLTRAGMSYEGRLRDNMHVKGGWRDSLVYSVLEDEWTATSGATAPGASATRSPTGPP